MNGFARWPPGLAALAALIVVLIQVAGCGSDEANTVPDKGSAGAETGAERELTPSPLAGGAGAGSAKDRGESDAGRGKGSGAREQGEGDDGSPRSFKNHPPVGRDVEGASGLSGATRREALESCPPSLAEDECRKVVKEVAQPAPSRSVKGAEECIEAMGQERCEEIARALDRASAGGGNVNAEECVKNPTPRCEKTLGPVLESIYAARHGGK